MLRGMGYMSTKKAWQYELEWITEAVPPAVMQTAEEEWLKYAELGNASDEQLFIDWHGEVPGSKAPSHLVPAAIQCMASRGYEVSEAEALIEAGLAAEERKDGAALQQITAKIYHILNTAKQDPESAYASYQVYRTFEDVRRDAVFPEASAYDVSGIDFEKRIRAGWTGQLIGGCLGTQLEGYTTANIRKRFGEVRGYLREPETYNDDITYELAYLDGFAEKGYEITSEDVAYKWLEIIAEGYSAERVALSNLRRGIMPPASGTETNYFSDWIGAQMRTMIHGMVAPGNPALAARLAADDSVVSHSNNGMIGGIFNAVLVSLCFTETDIRTVLEKTIACMPQHSEYKTVTDFALRQCRTYDNWEEAWAVCEKKFQEYNWVHAYPNAAAEIVALWYGNMDFDETCHIIAMEGQDVDCTAAPILNALAIMRGYEVIGKKWTDPIGNDIYTMMRKMKHMTLEELCDKTVAAVRRAVE